MKKIILVLVISIMVAGVAFAGDDVIANGVRYETGISIPLQEKIKATFIDTSPTGKTEYGLDVVTHQSDTPGEYPVSSAELILTNFEDSTSWAECTLGGTLAITETTTHVAGSKALQVEKTGKASTISCIYQWLDTQSISGSFGDNVSVMVNVEAGIDKLDYVFARFGDGPSNWVYFIIDNLELTASTWYRFSGTIGEYDGQSGSGLNTKQLSWLSVGFVTNNATDSGIKVIFDRFYITKKVETGQASNGGAEVNIKDPSTLTKANVKDLGNYNGLAVGLVTNDTFAGLNNPVSVYDTQAAVAIDRYCATIVLSEDTNASQELVLSDTFNISEIAIVNEGDSNINADLNDWAETEVISIYTPHIEKYAVSKINFGISTGYATVKVKVLK